MFVIKAIKPRKLRIDAFRLESLTGLHDMEGQVKKDFKKTIETWQGDKPKFDSAISLKQPGPTLIVDASGGPEKGVKKWNWLNKGTPVRRALMSKDWKSKTRPGLIGSGAGRGRMLFVSRKLKRPGIKARGWTAALEKKWAPKFRKRMEEAMRIATKKCGHGA